MLYKDKSTKYELPFEELGNYFNYEQLSIITLFQRRWAELAVYMRSYIHAAIEGSPRSQIAAERLMRISNDFHEAMLIFYGPQLANQITDLSTAFISKPTNIIEGFQSDNRDLIDQSIRDWYRDANTLANFLASINLYWDPYQWRILLHQYIQLTVQMIASMNSQDYAREIQVFDKFFDLTSILGSYMARGLIARQSERRSSSPPIT